MATIARICRYPVKGLSAEPLERVQLATGEGLPLDRKFALARPGTTFDPARPAWLPKTRFLMLMKDERLATLRVAYDDASGRLRIDQPAGAREPDQISADVRTAPGCAAIEAFFESFMGKDLGGRPHLVSARGHTFTDSEAKYVSLINLATVEEFERTLGRPVDPLRFRANLYVADLPAWAEFDWLGRDLAAGGVRFRVAERIDRCAATNVDPETGERDLNIPLTLRQRYGHIDCGVFLRVVECGEIAVGQTIAPVDP